MSNSKQAAEDRFGWIEQACFDHELSAVDVRVAIAIACHINAKSLRAWPTQETIASKIGHDIRVVRRAIKNLARTGHIQIIKARIKKTPDNYMLGKIRPDKNAPTEVVSDRTNLQVCADKNAKVTGQIRPTEPITEPIEEPVEYISDPFLDFWDVYPLRKSKRAAERSFRQALKRADAKTIIEGARRYALERAGQNPQYTRSPKNWLEGDDWTNETQINTHHATGFESAARAAHAFATRGEQE